MTHAGGLRGTSFVESGTTLQGKHRLKTTGGAVPDQDDVGPSDGQGAFTRFALEYAAQRTGRPISILQAGCTTAGQDLDLAALRAAGHVVDESLIDDSAPNVAAAAAARPELALATLGELRLLPLLPRSFDIVLCPLLLHRIRNAELVLDRLVAAIQPGGLLLLRIADPGSAAGFLDRWLPGPLRALAWRGTRLAETGLYPAIYEPVATARGIELFTSRHGLSVAHRAVARAVDSSGQPGPARGAATLISRLSRGHLSSEYDELCYVVRKPEDRFARVLQ